MGAETRSLYGVSGDLVHVNRRRIVITTTRTTPASSGQQRSLRQPRLIDVVSLGMRILGGVVRAESRRRLTGDSDVECIVREAALAHVILEVSDDGISCHEWRLPDVLLVGSTGW